MRIDPRAAFLLFPRPPYFFQERAMVGKRAMKSKSQSPAWQPIESAPKDGTAILITSQGFHTLVDIGRYALPELRSKTEPSSEDWWVVRGKPFVGARGGQHRPGMVPTHWMPLPEAPE